ncbi:hypothetical protein N9Z83_00015 [Akkermansiaceae bacterium]|nr:hypothetical protein [Akkermansiaceae bacterium]
MKVFVLVLFSCLPVFGQGGIIQVPPKQPVPEEVMLSAQKATQTLIAKSVRGDFRALVEKEYPAWSKIAARGKFPDIKSYQDHSVQRIKDMVAGGFVFQAAIAQQPMVGYEVNFKGDSYRNWMVFVPTVNDYAVMDRAVQPPRLRKIRSRRFQIAISSKAELAAKGGDAWTFISGAGITGLQLRQLFPFLPKDEKQLGFPPVENEERK